MSPTILRDGVKLMAISFLVLLLFVSLPLITGQPGFISIDCGKPPDYNYKDEKTSILYLSDSSYIDTGVNHNISTKVPISPLNSVQAQDLRSFPEGKRNCYSLRPVTEGTTYIARAFFLYGNYDGENGTPQFDLYIDTNFWSSVKIINSSETYIHEQFTAALGNSISMCLVDTGLGRPFVSALELRPIEGAASYADKVNPSLSLTMVKRVNFGGSAGSFTRYPEDIFDRIWEPLIASSWKVVSTTELAKTNTEDKLPLQIMQTAVTPTIGSSINFSWPVNAAKGESEYYISQHFAELVPLTSNETRIFNFSIDGSIFLLQVSPKYLEVITYYYANPRVFAKLDFHIYETNHSTLPPIINALEIYMINHLKENVTYVGDVEALMDIKAAYKILKFWSGDPCAPIDFVWDGLKCSYSSKPYRIISLNLSSSGLTGPISNSLANLTKLKYLDLSMNNLTGGIPSFLAHLSNLEVLNLSCSGLNGPTPNEFLNQPSIQLLLSDSCTYIQKVNQEKRKNNVVAIVLAVVGSLALLLVTLGLFMFWRWKKKHGIPRKTESLGHTIRRNESQWSEPYCRVFTSLELTKMTNNFEKVIGKGGFGEVFYGLMDNDKPVAVKRLFKLTQNSIRQFRAEISILKRVHQRFLVPFIGYCEDKDDLALVYAYMSKGSLADYMAGKPNEEKILSWSKRLQVASEAAQGLEYLHIGCQKPIVHRDVKAANILLTEDLEVKIADFGISKIFSTHGDSYATTDVIGTPGYLDPEYSMSGMLTEKSDVYSFGIVLLELITGLPCFFGNVERTHIVQHVEGLLNNGDLRRIVDEKLLGAYDENSAWKVLDTAMACVAPSSVDRPTMSEVVVQLKECVVSVAAYKGANNPNTIGFPDSMTGPSAR